MEDKGIVQCTHSWSRRYGGIKSYQYTKSSTVYRHDFLSIPMYVVASSVFRCFAHVCFVQVTILKLVWRNRRALSYWYLFCDPRRWDNSRKVRAPRRVSTLGAPHLVTWTKQTWTKQQCTASSSILRAHLCPSNYFIYALTNKISWWEWSPYS